MHMCIDIWMQARILEVSSLRAWALVLCCRGETWQVMVLSARRAYSWLHRRGVMPGFMMLWLHRHGVMPQLDDDVLAVTATVPAPEL